MARTTTTTGRRQSGATHGAKSPAVKSGRASAAKKTTSTRKIATAVKPKAATRSAARTTVQSKQELRDRIEKLERANVVRRTKNREAVEASREAANRIDQLEEQLTRHAATGQPEREPRPADEAPARPAARRGRKPKPTLPVEAPVIEADDQDGA